MTRCRRPRRKTDGAEPHLPFRSYYRRNRFLRGQSRFLLSQRA
ncbi:hypothetical protein HMPREF0972_00011 [Actinomyces sp. oral taxon 848 str. F0332]|nr:hypothetical protein HMPREF0972_00011 [Actinomyces sp. oral taxon 848 str. F0332]